MKQTKTFNVILPKELWSFLKKKAVEEETSMAKLLISYVEKLKRRADKKELTQENANV